MSIHPAPVRRAAPPWAARIVAPLLLAGLICAFHARSLDYGLFLDDHAHVRQLRECGWSLHDLTSACRLEIAGGVAEFWFMPDATLRFFRPLAFGLMKVVYTLAGWDPVWQHAASLAWHFAACWLLYGLLRRLAFGRRIAFGAAALFAIHPAHVATVQWIACQTELMVTTFLLGATICWGRWRGWSGFGGERGDAGSLWIVSCALLFVAALGCRENAVAFPFVMLIAEPFVGRPGRRRALAAYAGFGLLIVGYLALRSAMLGGAALPPRPYVIGPGDPDFARFVFDKTLYYLLGEFLFAPIIPFGGVPYLRERPALFYGASAAVVVLTAALFWANRRRLGGPLAPAWLLAFMAPVLPAFASPHHLYLPGVGWALAAAQLLRLVAGPTAPSPAPAGASPSRFRLRAGLTRRTAAVALFVFLFGALGTTTFFFGLAIETAQGVEDVVADEVAGAGPLHDGQTLYFANLPLMAHYVRLCVEERTGARNLRAVVLTWAPRMLGMATSSELTWLDDRTCELRVAEDRWFAGPLGYLAAEAAGRALPAQEPGSPARHGCRVEIVAGDAAGVSTLRVTFDRPLSASGARLFWGSRTRWALDVTPVASAP